MSFGFSMSLGNHMPTLWALDGRVPRNLRYREHRSLWAGQSSAWHRVEQYQVAKQRVHLFD